ncbi:hypothetical protein CR513_37543, partial [Mucuna pruriens]
MREISQYSTYGNPGLYQIQLGDPTPTSRVSHIAPPSEELLMPFMVHELGLHHIRILRRVRMAWKHISRRGRDLGPRSHGFLASYKDWLQSWVELVRLPFKDPVSAANKPERSGHPRNVEDESANELIDMKNKEKSLKRKLEEAYVEQRATWEEVDQERRVVESMAKRVKAEE